MWPLVLLAALAVVMVGVVIWDDRKSKRQESKPRSPGRRDAHTHGDRGAERQQQESRPQSRGGSRSPAARKLASQADASKAKATRPQGVIRTKQRSRASTRDDATGQESTSPKVCAEPSLDSLRERAKALARQDRFGSDAVMANEAIIAQCPHDVDAWNRLGRCHLNSNRPHDAERAFRRALAVDPASSIASNGICDAVTLQSRSRGALSVGHASSSDSESSIQHRHQDFLRSRGQSYQGSRAATRRPRVTHCWRCKQHLDSRTFTECLGCSGIICECGACFCR
jgi:Flp pilus assembly protein TadD